MKKLECKDISGQDCPYVAEGETDEEIKPLLGKHGETVHPEMMAALTDEEKTAMEQKINDRLAQQS